MSNNNEQSLSTIENSSFASREEIEDAIRNLTSGDKKKLMTSARLWWKKFGLHRLDLQPEDLLQEAIYRALKEEKARKWPKYISFNKFISRSMESIASHYLEKYKDEMESHSIEDLPNGQSIELDRDSETSTTDDRLEAQAELKRLETFFGNDTIAFKAVISQIRP